MIRYLSFIFLINCVLCTETQITQTVYGFLDFTTTIGNTVMVFSPQSAPSFDIPVNKTPPKPTSIIETRPIPKQNEPSKDGIRPTPLIATSSKEESETTSSLESNNLISPAISNTPIKTLDYPEYALLSRQPEEFVEETFRLVNLKSRSEGDRQRVYPSKRDNSHNLSSGFLNKKIESVSKISAISAKSSIKYAQGPQSISSSEKRNKNRSQSSSRVLKTITPQSSRAVESTSQQNGFSKSNRKSNRDPSEKRKSSRNKGKRRHKNTHGSSTQITATAVDTNASTRRSFRTKTNQPSLPSLPSPPSEENFTNLGQNNLKLNRRPGRWQYKSAPKPKVNIRKTSNNTNNNKTATNTDSINEAILETDDKFVTQKSGNLARDLEAVGSQNSVVADNDELKPKDFVRTLNVEISTPSNFVDTYYEIATIKSPFVFQAGLVKKTRFLTITSTIEKTLKTDQIEEYSKDDGPLSENILESTISMNEPSLDGSILTLKPIYITDSLETPELETITDSFSVTQTKLRTQILPIVFEKKNETTQITLVQTFDYTSLVTVTQTISPFRDNFIPAKSFKDFSAILDEAGSELNLDLEFGDEGNGGQFEGKVKWEAKGNSTSILPNTQSDKLSAPEISAINPLNPNNNVITSTRPVVKLETIWESYVVPLVRGTDSVLRTLSKSVGVVEKTEYITEVSTLPVLPMSQYPYSINPFYNPLLQLPQQQLITSTSILNTLVTATSSKVLKLTFGARTAYTTIFSTSVVPTEVTQLITATLPVQNQGGFPNYYPPPYPPFGYVG